MACPNMVSRKKTPPPQWLRVISLLMMGIVVVLCSYSYGEQLPLSKQLIAVLPFFIYDHFKAQLEIERRVTDIRI